MGFMAVPKLVLSLNHALDVVPSLSLYLLMAYELQSASSNMYEIGPTPASPETASWNSVPLFDAQKPCPKSGKSLSQPSGQKGLLSNPSKSLTVRPEERYAASTPGPL